MDNRIVYFHSAQAGALPINGVAGSLIAIFDAALVNDRAAVSATISVTSEVATIVFSTSQPFLPLQVLRVAGVANHLALNGRKKILSGSGTTYTFAAPGVADGSATGSITAALACADWQKVFSATNVAVYRSQAVDGCRMYLRVDDTGDVSARVVQYESMDDISTGFNPSPTELQIPGGGHFPKSPSAGATARHWTLVADHRTLYWRQSFQDFGGSMWMFGDFNPEKAGDSFASALVAASSNPATTFNPLSTQVDFFTSVGGTNAFIARNADATSFSVSGLHGVEGSFSTGGASGSGKGYPSAYPNPANQGLYLLKKVFYDSTSSRRGTARGLYLCPQDAASQFNSNQLISGAQGLDGKQLLAVRAGAPYDSGSPSGVVFFDVTGPW